MGTDRIIYHKHSVFDLVYLGFCCYNWEITLLSPGKKIIKLTLNLILCYCAGRIHNFIQSRYIKTKVLCNLQYASENVATQSSRNLNRGVKPFYQQNLNSFLFHCLFKGLVSKLFSGPSINHSCPKLLFATRFM